MLPMQGCFHSLQPLTGTNKCSKNSAFSSSSWITAQHQFSTPEHFSTTTMFERLGEIVETGERFESCEDDHEELPPIFRWFPKQEAFVPPPPMDETAAEKMDRIS